MDPITQARIEQQQRLREAARQQLSAQSPDQFAKVLMGVVAGLTAVAGLGAGYYLSQTPHDTDVPLVPMAISKPLGAAGGQGKPEHLTTVIASAPQEPVSALAKSSSSTLDQKPDNNTLALKASDPAPVSAIANEPLSKPAIAKSTAAKENANVEFQVPSSHELAAFNLLEDAQQLQPLSGVASRTMRADRLSLQQALTANDQQTVASLINSVNRPYARSLLLLEQMQWQLQQQQLPAVQKSIEDMRKVLAETRDIDQQVLVMGALSKAYLLLDDRAKAEASVQQAIAKAADVPRRSFQALLLVQLANEQALLGNSATTRKLLKLAEPLLSPLAEDMANTAKPAQIICLYALINDFDEAKTRLRHISNDAKRERLNNLITQLEAS